MHKTLMRTIIKRVEELTKFHTVIIPNWDNGIYKPITMKYEEARQLAVREIEANS